MLVQDELLILPLFRNQFILRVFQKVVSGNMKRHCVLCFLWPLLPK